MSSVKQAIADTIKANDAEDKRQGRVDYDRTAFMLKDQHGTVISGPYKLPGRDEHRRLLAAARSRHLYVWMAAVTEVAGRLVASQPHLIDWDSVPDPSGGVGSVGGAAKAANVKVAGEQLTCPHCGKICTSTSGYTLHMNGKHGGKQS